MSRSEQIPPKHQSEFLGMRECNLQASASILEHAKYFDEKSVGEIASFMSKVLLVASLEPEDHVTEVLRASITGRDVAEQDTFLELTTASDDPQVRRCGYEMLEYTYDEFELRWMTKWMHDADPDIAGQARERAERHLEAFDAGGPCPPFFYEQMVDLLYNCRIIT